MRLNLIAARVVQPRHDGDRHAFEQRPTDAAMPQAIACDLVWIEPRALGDRTEDVPLLALVLIQPARAGALEQERRVARPVAAQLVELCSETAVIGTGTCWRSFSPRPLYVFDRVIVQGTLPVFCYADGMTAYLSETADPDFRLPQVRRAVDRRINENAEKLATDTGLQIDYVRKNFRKEDRVKAPEKRGKHRGWCASFRRWSPVRRTSPGTTKWTDVPGSDDGKCLHYYFYFIDEELGLCYVRVPTWLPLRLQIYFNGHNWLARQLDPRRSATRLDNAFTDIADWQRTAALQRVGAQATSQAG